MCMAEAENQLLARVNIAMKSEVSSRISAFFGSLELVSF